MESFGASALPVTGFKWSLGHTLAASGVIEAILTLRALRENTVPGIATLERRDHTCAGVAASAKAAEPRTPVALMMTRAFAGLNSCLVMTADVR